MFPHQNTPINFAMLFQYLDSALLKKKSKITIDLIGFLFEIFKKHIRPYSFLIFGRA